MDADKIGFFFGAGASIEFGIPSMKKITTTFANEVINKDGDSKERQIFDLVYNSLANVYGQDKVDIEAIISVIAGLREKEQLKENIGELGLFMLQTAGNIGRIKEFDHDTYTLNELENRFKQYIRKVVIPESNKIDLARIIFLDFFKQVCGITNCDCPGCDDSNSSKYTHGKWTFITTNYDNMIEDFWVKERRYVNLNLGFEDHIMDADRFVLNNTEYATRSMQLVKLHGSVNWVKNKYGQIEEREYHTSLDVITSRSGSTDIQEDVIIYPLSQKQLYFTPYMQLFRIFDIELRRRDFWIIIGYSCRDVIIRTMFERALTENSKRKVLLVHPHATEQIRPLFKEGLRNQLTCLDKYFAKENYSEVNEEIAYALSNLANNLSIV